MSPCPGSDPEGLRRRALDLATALPGASPRAAKLLRLARLGLEGRLRAERLAAVYERTAAEAERAEALLGNGHRASARAYLAARACLHPDPETAVRLTAARAGVEACPPEAVGAS